MKYLVITVAVIAGVAAEADPKLLVGGAVLPYAASAVVATPPHTPASTVKIAPILPAAPVLGYAGLPYTGLPHAGIPYSGYAGLPYSGLAYSGNAGLPYTGLAYSGFAGHPYLGRKKRDAEASVLLANSAPNALPVVTIPEPATTGYAVGASGAIGGQAPIAAIEPVAVAAPVIAAPTIAAYSLGYAAAPALTAAHLGYAAAVPALGATPTIVASAIAAPAVAAPAIAAAHLGYAAHPFVYGKSAPCVNAANIPVPCANGLPFGYAGLRW